MDLLDRLLTWECHGLFVWGAWLPCLVLLVAEALLVRRRLRRARASASGRVDEATA